MPFGKERLTVTRPYKYLYSGEDGTNLTPLCQPPARGCKIRAEAVGTPGTVKIYGTVGGVSTSETITSFDAHNVGFGTKRFTAITKFDITGFDSATIYAADDGGEIKVLSSSTTFKILADTYSVNVNQTRGTYIEVAGKTVKSYKQILYDRRWPELQYDDKVNINNLEHTVVHTEVGDNDVRMAFAVVWR